LQITPNNNNSYFDTVQNDFDIDGFSLSGIGGPALLGKHLVQCQNPISFDVNIFFQYTAASVTFGDPLKGGGSGTGSCWVVAFDPSATAVTTGTVSSFTGFSGLLSPPARRYSLQELFTVKLQKRNLVFILPFGIKNFGRPRTAHKPPAQP